MYRVSWIKLAELSGIFAALLTLPPPEAVTYNQYTGKPMPPEGQSDEHPVKLYNATSTEFDYLCMFLFEP